MPNLNGSRQDEFCKHVRELHTIIDQEDMVDNQNSSSKEKKAIGVGIVDPLPKEKEPNIGQVGGTHLQAPQKETETTTQKETV